MPKCDPCRDCGDCPPPKFRPWIRECLLAVQDCHERAGTVEIGGTVPRHPDRAWLEKDGYFRSTIETCVRGGLLRDAEDGLVLTAKGLAFLEGE